MPAKSKQQQKFMGLVHAYKKGEVPASKVSKSVKDAAKSMSKKSVKKYAKTKHDELPKKVTEKKERDYKAEYRKFQSSTKAKKYRAELNKYNRQKGTYGNGDGKDASHKGGKIVGFEAQSKNRGRREKSRLKKESIVFEDITKLERLAMNLLRNINKNAGVQKYDHKKTADFNKVVKFLKGKMPKVPNQRIGQIAMSYHDYRKKQPKIRIPDIDSVKDMEKTLKKLGMKEGINERAWTPAQEKAVKELDKKFYKLIGKKGIEPYSYEASQMWTSGGFRKEMRKIFGKDESINEQQYFDPKGKLKKYMDKVLKQAGIRVIKYDPMKQSFYNGAWGGFYTVASSNKVDMPGQGKVKRSSAVLPVYIDKKGEVELGVSGDGFKLGKAGSSQVLKNLKDFKKGDLEESINETPYELGGMKVYSKADGLKKVKSMQKTGGAKIYKVTKTKTKLYGKHPVTMYNLHTKNKNHSTNQNPYGLDMMKGVYLIPIEEGTCGYGLDGNLGEEPAGPHLMKKIKKITKDKEKKLKENKQEKLQIAKTILSQLGGNRFVAMTGAKKFAYDSKGSSVSLQFRIGRNAKQVNIVKINYIRGKDLYEMEFYKGTKLLKKVSNIYADQLQKMFTKHTGMYTSL